MSENETNDNDEGEMISAKHQVELATTSFSFSWAQQYCCDSKFEKEHFYKATRPCLYLYEGALRTVEQSRSASRLRKAE
jgi:hypothetical protein